MSDPIKLRYILPLSILAVAFCFVVGIAVTGVVWAGGEEEAAAVSVPEAVPAASPFEQRVEIIAMTCAACHGTDGRKASAIPALAGKPSPVLSALLMAFKQDQMPDATVMPRLTKGYTEEELRAVAEYFASLNVE
jgi:cytochrome c553